jgi:phytoene synthase
VLAGGREPLISQIKLAWWRDSLVALDFKKPPAEPMLEAVAAELLPKGVNGAQLSEMEEAWTMLLGQEPLTPSDLELYARQRGALIFRYSAHLLGGELTSGLEKAGEGWALVDLARHSNEIDAKAALEAAAERLKNGSERWPTVLRPLGMLVRLARRDAMRPVEEMEPYGTPARMWQMLRHRFSGR